MSLPAFFWPPEASAHAREVDLLIGSFGAMVWLLTLPVFILMAAFAIRYRRGREVNREHSGDGNVWLEASWSIIPFLLTIGFFVWATSLFLEIRRVPEGATPIHVVAKQWMWKYEHPEGAREINDLHVPVDTPVVLVMSSEDVIHSLYVPALRIKQDVLPGRYTHLSFVAERAGTYPLRCAEFCGTDHSVMGGRLVVMRREDYARWLASARDGGRETMAQRGAALFRSAGCAACHASRRADLAPPLAGIYGRTVRLADGSSATVDEQYLRDAIVDPNRQIAAGYRPIMPTYAHALAARDIDALVAWLREGGQP